MGNVHNVAEFVSIIEVLEMVNFCVLNCNEKVIVLNTVASIKYKNTTQVDAPILQPKEKTH